MKSHKRKNEKNTKPKITLIIPCNTHWSPFINKYLMWLKETGGNYNVIIWNREGIEEKFEQPSFEFGIKDNTNNRNLLKIYKFFAFASFIKKTLRQHGGEKLMFMGTYAAIPALLSQYLKKHYRNAYWIDIRDYTYERFSLYVKLIAMAINNSYVTAISSRGFLRFLPPADYLYIHNVNTSDIAFAKNEPIQKESAIRISFIGNVRYFDQNEKLLTRLGNDSRFVLQYFGSGSEHIEKYCKQNQIKNVNILGRFNYKQTSELYEQADIINNLYGNQTIEVKTALSNKLYYSAIYKKPIIVNTKTYMAEIIDKYNMGISIDLDDENIGDRLYDWYTQYDYNASGYNDFINLVLSDEEKTYSTFKDFLNN